MAANKKVSMKQKAYESIKKKILSCSLKPGKDINEEKLAEELGVSRTPVREALMRLEQEKLIVVYPRKGIFVAQITLKEIQEIFQIREMIETQVALIVLQSLDDQELLRFKEKFEQIDKDGHLISCEEYFQLDFEFHKFIVKSSKNENLIEFMNNIYDKDYRIRVLTTQMDADEASRNKKQHLEIIETFIAKDTGSVIKCIKEHISRSKIRSLEMIVS